MKKTGLYFGSFNPIHLGHLIVAEAFASSGDYDEVWLVVSPHNPLKTFTDLAPQENRLEMVRMSIEGNPLLIASNIEFGLPTPSFTHQTLAALLELHPDRVFSILLGEDTKMNFHLWKNYLWILENFSIIFFPREVKSEDPGVIPWSKYRVSTFDGPLIGISSTLIRERIKKGKSIRYQVPESVKFYIENQRLYK